MSTLIELPEQVINDPRGSETSVWTRCACCQEPEYTTDSYQRCDVCGDRVCQGCLTTAYVEAIEQWISEDTTVVVEPGYTEQICATCAKGAR